MIGEKALNDWVGKIRKKRNLPIRIRLWNNKEFDLSDKPPLITIIVPEISSLPFLLDTSIASLGTAYVEGKIDVEGKLTDIIQMANELSQTAIESEGGFAARVVKAFKHTKESDSNSIKYHYDVSNEFYSQFLDSNMVYSCAYFENGDEDLATAQIKKIDHILKKIRVQPGQRLLDIGCGWGALVLRAAQKFGAKCVGITLSEQQFELATKRVKDAGLENQIEIRLQDYRDVAGTFDRITSVGMFEHVGRNHLVEYFQKLHSILDDDGIVMNHGITSTDSGGGETPYGGGEFIDKYVFPQGELSHISHVLKTAQDGGFEATDIESLRFHYAKTLSIWSENFEKNSDKIRQLVDEKHYRIWRVYLPGCVYGFMQDWVSIYQVVCIKSGKTSPFMPMSRRYIYE